MENDGWGKFLKENCLLNDNLVNKLTEFFESNLVDVSDLTMDNIEDYVNDFKEAFFPKLVETMKNDIMKKLRDGVSKSREEVESKDDGIPIKQVTPLLSEYDKNWKYFLENVCAGINSDMVHELISFFHRGSVELNDMNCKTDVEECLTKFELPDFAKRRLIDKICVGLEVLNDVDGKNIIDCLKTEYASSDISDIFWAALISYANKKWIQVSNMLNQCTSKEEVANYLRLDDINYMANVDINKLRQSVFEVICCETKFELETMVRVVNPPDVLKDTWTGDPGEIIGFIKKIKPPKKKEINPIKVARDTEYSVKFTENVTKELNLHFHCWELEIVEIEKVDTYNLSVRCWTGATIDIYIDDDACLLSGVREKALDRMCELGIIMDMTEEYKSKLGFVFKISSTKYGKMDKRLNEYLKIGQYTLSEMHKTPRLYFIPHPPHFLDWHKDQVCLKWDELVKLLSECNEYFEMYQKTFAIMEECCKRAMLNAGGVEDGKSFLSMMQSINYLDSLIINDDNTKNLIKDLKEKTNQRNATDHNASEIFSDHFKAMSMLDVAFRVLKFLCDIPAERLGDWTNKHLEDARNRLVKSTSQIALETLFDDIIDKKIRYFVGRTEIIGKLQKWYEDTNQLVRNNRHCTDMAAIIYGNAGVGKSTLLGKLIKDDNLKLRNKMLCYHICNAREPSTLLVSSFIVRIVDTIKSKFPSYVKWYNSQGNESTRNIVKSLDQNEYRLDYVIDFQNCVTNGLMYVEKMLKEQNAEDKTDEAMDLWLIVIDSLDEGLSTGESNNSNNNNTMTITGLLLELITTQSALFPSWVKFVCTSRKIADVTNRVEGKTFEIDSESASNYLDISNYKNERIVAYDREHCQPNHQCIMCNLAQTSECSVLSTVNIWQQSYIMREMQSVFGIVCSFLDRRDIIEFSITCRLHVWRYNINFQSKFLTIVGGNFQYINCFMSDLEKDNASTKRMLGVESIFRLNAGVPGDLVDYYSQFFGIRGKRSRFVNKAHQLCVILSIIHSNNNSIRRDHLIDIAAMRGVSVEDCQYILDNLESILSCRLDSDCILHNEDASAKPSLVYFAMQRDCTCKLSFYHESVVDWIRNDKHMKDYSEAAYFLTWMWYARGVVAFQADSTIDGTASLSVLSYDDWNRNYNAFVKICRGIYPQWCKYLTDMSEVDIYLFLNRYGLSHKDIILKFLMCSYDFALRSGCFDLLRELLKGLCNQSQCGIGELISKDCAILLIHRNVEFCLLFDPLLLSDESKQIALSLAATRNNLKILKHLILCGVCVNVRDNNRDTPLYHACMEGHVNVVEVLLSHGADVNDSGNDEDTPLYQACDKGYVNVVEVLLSHGADVNDSRNDESPLHKACGRCNVYVVEVLLSHEADVNARDNDGYTPLHTACCQGHVNVVEVLLSHGANVNACGNDGDTPLYQACDKGYVNVVEVLLSRGADVNAKDNWYTPLHTAHIKGYVNVVEVLLSHRADVHAIDNWYTPLHTAHIRGYVNVVEILLSHGADINAGGNDGDTPFYPPCFEGHVNVFEVLLSHGTDKNVTSRFRYTPLHEACDSGHIDVVKELLSHGADVNARDNGRYTPLHRACIYGHVNVVEVLLSHGADITTIGITPLHTVCYFGHVNIVKVLLSHETYRTVINTTRYYLGYTPLHTACYSGHVNVVEVLLSHGADINAKGNDGYTPLHEATTKGHVNVVKVLLSHGAHINASFNRGNTPLHTACYSGHANVVDVLLSHGADVNARDNRGYTPLHTACYKGHVNVVEVLLSHGADVNATMRIGNSTFHEACDSGHVNVVEVLLCHGADVNTRDNDGYTPLHKACIYGHESVVEVLLSHGADINASDKSNGDKPLHKACDSGHVNVVEVLLSHGAPINDRSNHGKTTPLHKACEAGHVNVVEVLLSHGADASISGRWVGTPLHQALSYGHANVVEVLLSYGAHVNDVYNYDGYTPLHCACCQGHVNVVEVLLSHGADVNTIDKYGSTPLENACCSGNVNVVEVLLSHGAVINTTRFILGYKPLHKACHSGHVNVVEVLLSHGADVNARDDDGYTPLHEACDKGHVNVVEVLLSRGADVNARDDYGIVPICFCKEFESIKLLVKAKCTLVPLSDFRNSLDEDILSLAYLLHNGANEFEAGRDGKLLNEKVIENARKHINMFLALKVF